MVEITQETPGPGRPPHEPTEATRKTVEALSGFGASHAYIAGEIGITENTLRKHYRAELDRGMEKADIAVAQTLFKRATGALAPGQQPDAAKADTTAAIFWAKTRMGWKETTRVETVPGDEKDGGSARERLASKLDGLARPGRAPEGSQRIN